MSLMAKADSNHWVTMDAPEEVGGSGAATRPIELFLMGLAGCTSMDVISLLTKKRVPFTDFKVQTTTEREDTHPKVFKSVNIHFQIFGNGIKEKDIARSIELSAMPAVAKSSI